MAQIKVANPVVDLDGEEIDTASSGSSFKEKLSPGPYLDLSIGLL